MKTTFEKYGTGFTRRVNIAVALTDENGNRNAPCPPKSRMNPHEGQNAQFSHHCFKWEGWSQFSSRSPLPGAFIRFVPLNQPCPGVFFFLELLYFEIPSYFRCAARDVISGWPVGLLWLDIVKAPTKLPREVLLKIKRYRTRLTQRFNVEDGGSVLFFI